MFKSRFPGKPVNRSRRRVSTGMVIRKGQNEAGTSGQYEAENIHQGYLTFVQFCGDSDEETDFHGFLDEEIEKTETLVEIRRSLIQSSLSLPEDEKFAAVDPKLLALYPPASALPQKPTSDSTPVQQVREEKTISKKILSKDVVTGAGDASTPHAEKTQISNRRKTLDPKTTTPPAVTQKNSRRKTLAGDAESISSPTPTVERPKRKSLARKEIEELSTESSLKAEETLAESSEPASKRGKRKSLVKQDVGNTPDKPSRNSLVRTDPEQSAATPTSKVLLRPSVLGDLTSGTGAQSFKEGAFSSSAATSSLVVEGKRQWKPSLKMQEQKASNATSLFGKSDFELPSPLIKKSITQYADAMSRKTDKNPDGVSAPVNEKIERMLASQWDSRLRKVDNKFVRTNSRIPSPEVPAHQQDNPVDKPAKPVLLRESKLVLNEGLLERLRSPSHQKEFYQAIQESMQSADKNPPLLVQEGLKKGSINPVGTALVEPMTANEKSFSQTSEEGTSGGACGSSKSNRRPGNIICGICGALRYYAFINQAKKFGTFSCEPCRKFISRQMTELEKDEKTSLSCISGTGMCVVPPVIRANANALKRKGDTDVRCEACWLKLCLIGYNLETTLYDRLRSCLPEDIFGTLLPEGANRNKSLVPHRGEILEINRQVPLSRPLFDGFGSQQTTTATTDSDVSKTEIELKKKASEVATSATPGSRPIVPLVTERLPNGWAKKAVKRLEGPMKGKWEMFLITPDNKILSSQTELKLYIAKSGAVIDSNIVNFALPKKTAKVDKTIGKLLAKSALEQHKEEAPAVEEKAIEDGEETEEKEEVEEVEETSEERKERTEKKVKREWKKLGMKSGSEKLPTTENRKRETKVPLKYRLDDELTSNTTPAKKPKVPKIVKTPKVVDEELPVPETPVDKTPEKVESTPGPSFVAVKSVPPPPSSPLPLVLENSTSSRVNLLSSIGVGTFSIDEDTAKRMSSGRFVNRNKVSRCGDCQGCRSDNCGDCPPCQDMIKFGGPGHVKQACVNRRCTNPKFPGIPSMSTFKTGNDLKRKYIKTAKGTNAHGDKMDYEEEFIDQDEDQKAGEETKTENQNTTVRVEPVEPIGPDRPNMSYSSLIAMAIQNSPEQKLTLGEIYTSIMNTFPYYQRVDKTGWQNSIRHNLSLHKAFIRQGDCGGRTGAYWTIDPKISFGSFKKIRRVDRQQGSKQSDLSNQVSTQTLDSSFWQPDPDTFIDNTSSGEATPKSVVKAKVEYTQDRRQSIEEFLEMGLSQSSDRRKVKILSALDMPQQSGTSNAVVVATKSVVVTQPQSELQKAMTVEDNEINESSRPPFMGSVEFYEQYDPDVARDIGQALITTEKLPIEWLCFLCGSAGREEMVFCRSCCEPFHPFCQDSAPTEVASDWLCGRCSLCQVCNCSGGSDQLKCNKCRKTFHQNCLSTNTKKLVEQQKQNWCCQTCLRCNSCDKADVTHFAKDEMTNDSQPLCSSCCLQKKKGSFCPLCQACYDDNDYDTRMVECSKCGGWVHAKCENMNEEKYQIISYLPDTVEFVCKCLRAGPNSDTHDSVGLMGHVALTPVSLDDHTDQHKDLLLPPQQQFSSSNREFVSMSNIVSDNHNDNLEVVEFIDVPTDIDMTGLDIDPEEIYQNLEEAANH